MNDLALWRSLRQRNYHEAELIVQLRAVAQWPLLQRLPFLGWLPPLFHHSNAGVRESAIACLAEAQGVPALRAQIHALEDPSPAVRYAAVESLRASVIGNDAARWAHVMFHPDPDIRTAGLRIDRTFPPPDWWLLYLLPDPVSAPVVRERLKALSLSVESLILILDYARRQIVPRPELRALVHAMSWDNCMNHLAHWGIRSQEEIDGVLASVQAADGPEQIHRVAGRHPVIDLFELFTDADDEASEKWFRQGRTDYVTGDDARLRIVASLLVSAVRWGHHRGNESRPLPWLKTCALLYPRLLGCAWFPLPLRRAGLQGLYEAGGRITHLPDDEVLTLLRSELCYRSDGLLDLWAVGGVLHLFESRPYQRLLKAIPIGLISASFEADPEAAIVFLGVADSAGEERKTIIRELCLQARPARARVLARLCLVAPADSLEFLDPIDAGLALELFQELLTLEQPIRENKVRHLATALAEKIVAGRLHPFLQSWLQSEAPEEHTLGLAILTAIGRNHEPRLLRQAVGVLGVEHLRKFVTVVNYAAGFPYDRELEIADLLDEHGDESLRAWARVRTRRSESKPIRTVDRDALLKSGLCHTLRADVDSARPNVDICASLLASYDLYSEVDHQFVRFAGNDPAFLAQLDREMIYSWRGETRLPLLGHAWLYRWEEHSAAFEAALRAQGRSIDQAFAIVDALTCPLLRQRIGDAVLRCLELGIRAHRAATLEVWNASFAAKLIEHLTGDLGESTARLLMFWRTALPDDPAWIELRPGTITRLVSASDAVRKILLSWIDSQGLPSTPAEQPMRDHPAVPDRLSPEETSAFAKIAEAGEPIAIMPWIFSENRSVSAAAQERWLALACRSDLSPAELLRPLESFSSLSSLVDTYVERVEESTLDAVRLLLFEADLSPETRFTVGRALTRRDRHNVLPNLIEALVQPDARNWCSEEDGNWFFRFAESLGHEERELALKMIASPHAAVYQRAARILLEPQIAGSALACQGLLNFLEAGTDRMRELRKSAASALHAAGWGKRILPLLLQEEIAWEPPYPDLFVGQTFDAISATIQGALMGDWGEVGEGMMLNLLLAEGVDSYLRQEGLLQLLQHAKADSVRQAARQKMTPSFNRSFKLRRVAETFAWGIRVGRELTGKLFGIEMISGEKLGYTRFNENKIYITPLPILRGEPYGREVVRALILHEYGHHMYHRGETAEAIWNQSRNEGLQRLLNLVSDEHLERNLRALDRRFGDQLKLLGAYAFQHTSREIALETLLGSMRGHAFEILSVSPLHPAKQAGCVSVMNGRILMQMERVGLSFARFVRALRMGLGNRHDDPKVEAALQLFRGKFRKSDMPRLYEITKKLRDIFGSETDILNSFDQDALLEAAGDELDDATEGITNEEIQGEVKKHLEGRSDRRRSDGPRGGRGLNLGPEEHFDPIHKVEQMPYDPTQHAALAHQVRRPAQMLRRFLQKLGIGLTQQRFRLTGKSFDKTRSRAVVLRGDPRMLIARELKKHTDLFIGVVIDCSGSMSHNANIDKAKLFGTLIAEAAKGYPGVDVRLFGFTDRVIYDAGSAIRCAVHSLEAGGGNNDAAGLWHAALAAKASRRRAKLLVMISDGSPTECTVNALRSLVTRLTKRMKICCAQVAVCALEHRCFPNYILLDQDNVEAGVRQFGNVMAKLVQQALRG